MRWAVATILAAAAAAGVWYRVEEQHRIKGEDARRQVLLSLNLAGGKLREVAMKINHEEEK
jgi:hypothetical protein